MHHTHTGLVSTGMRHWAYHVQVVGKGVVFVKCLQITNYAGQGMVAGAILSPGRLEECLISQHTYSQTITHANKHPSRPRLHVKPKG
jgi:hypothetical protein